MLRLTTAMAAAALVAGAAPAWANLKLANEYACTGCHKVGTKLIGPAFTDVAAKYAGKKDALATVMANIRAGGTGQWGPVPMPPQPALSEADLKALASWILGGAK